jgi:hypothetical protein
LLHLIFLDRYINHRRSEKGIDKRFDTMVSLPAVFVPTGSSPVDH